LTDAALASAEATLAVRLPPGLVDLLRVQNGGKVRLRHPECTIEDFYGISLPFVWGPLRSLPGLRVVFGSSSGGDLVLDYQDRGPTDEPEVILAYTGMPGEEFLAPSFDAFLAALRLDEESDTIFGLTTGLELGEAALRLAAALDAELELQPEGRYVGRVGARNLELGANVVPRWSVTAASDSDVPPPQPFGWPTARQRIDADPAATGLRLPECPEADVVLVVETFWLFDGDTRSNLDEMLDTACKGLGWSWRRATAPKENVAPG
jgi:hypothetical protein